MGSKWEEKWGVFSKCEKSELQSYSYAFPHKANNKTTRVLAHCPPRNTPKIR